MIRRYNSEGIAREDLMVALRTPKQVNMARSVNACLLCCAANVNEAGLCNVCYSLLNGEELNLACRWLAGLGP
jgi:hypothetical protein